MQHADGKKVQADRENRQKRIDQAAVDDDFDVQEPGPENRKSKSKRDKDGERRSQLLADEGLEPEDGGKLVEENKGAEARQQAKEDPFDLGPVLFEGSTPVGQDKMKNGQEKEEDQIGAKDLKNPNIYPECGKRRFDGGGQHGRDKEDTEEKRQEIDEKRLTAPPPGGKGQGKMEEQGRGQRIKKVEEDNGNIGEPAVIQNVSSAADDQRIGENQSQPVEQPRLGVFPSQDEDGEPDEIAEQTDE
jgi:hypothetical protein